MPHVVLMGPGLPPEELRQRLARWGMTSALAASSDAACLPTVHDCDAVIWFGESPSATAEAGRLPAAPVLLVADGDPRTPSWRVIPPRKAAGDCLRRALQHCFARARFLREREPGDPLQLRFRDFLGHELRSPLTAIRTALEEIAAAPDDAGPLPEIGLRNVDRLQHVLEWSQDLLALAELPEESAAAVLATLAEDAPWAAAAAPDDADSTLLPTA